MAVRVLASGQDGWVGVDTPRPFTVDGVVYPTLVHWVQADKARAFRDEGALAAILAASDVPRARQAGRTVKGFEPAAWDRAEALHWGLLHVCTAYPDAADWLDDTGEDELVVADDDPVWGIGAGADPHDPSTWTGTNELGQALARVREVRRRQPTEEAAFGHDVLANPRPLRPVSGPIERDSLSLKQLLFGFRGGIANREFVIGHSLGLTVTGLLCTAIPPRIPPLEAAGWFVVLGLYGWITSALYAKRFRSSVAGVALGALHTSLAIAQLIVGTHQPLFGWCAVGLVMLVVWMPAPSSPEQA